MKKRIIALTVSLCLLFTGTFPVYADDEYPIKEYYNLPVKHTNGDGDTVTVNADFMVRTVKEGQDPLVYIKAEDFAGVASNAGYSHEYQKVGNGYVYGQSITECAYVCSETAHVVRFLLDSDDVAVVYVNQDLVYKSPYKTLYEDGVVWIPFEFAAKIFYMQAEPGDGHIKMSSEKYNPVSVANVIHNDIRDWGFDWIDEVGQSMGEYFWSMSGGIAVTFSNKLLSFEPSEWGAMMASAFGDTSYADAGMAEDISKIFLAPSDQEVTEIEGKKGVKILKGALDLEEKFDDIVKKDPADIVSFMEILSKELPAITKNGGFQRIKKALKDTDFKKFANDIFTNYKKGWSDKSTQKGLDLLVDMANMLEYYCMFADKSERAADAMVLYGEESKYDEGKVFRNNGKVKSPFLGALRKTLGDKATDIANGAITGALGFYGAILEVAGLAWSFLSTSVQVVNSVITTADNRTVSEYAIRYQDDCLGVYYKYRNECGTSNGQDGDSLNDMVNSLYAYMKFSYIARNAAQASFTSKSEHTYFNDKKREGLIDSADTLNEKNRQVAELLAYMEPSMFAPSDVKNVDWDDKVYAEVIKGKGTPVEHPTQSTVPVFELAEFPGAKGVDYIDEEEAIELVKKVVNKFTGGILEGPLGKILGSALGTDEIYTYKVVDHYMNGNTNAYVVQMYTGDIPDAQFFVSIIGNEVWMGTPAESQPGGYFVYTDLDLLHANVSDLVSTAGNLATELFSEMMKEQ